MRQLMQLFRKTLPILQNSVPLGLVFDLSTFQNFQVLKVNQHMKLQPVISIALLLTRRCP